MPVIVRLQSEVTVINKQRFLPELGKLLTFMVEEDRQTALAMYGRLFDDAEDEQQLMDLLVSPTRQAVVIARTYDARERRQRLEALEKGSEDQVPAFVLAIDKIYQQVAPHHGELTVEQPETEEEPQPVDQFSLFEDDAHPIDDSEYVPFRIEADAVPLEAAVEELPLEPQPEPEEEDGPKAPAEEEEEPGEAPEEPVEEPEEETEPQVLAEEEQEPEEELPPPQPVEPVVPEPVKAAAPVSAAAFDLDYVPDTRLKPRVFLLILFILLAVPVTLAGVILLLIPTILALALAVAVIVLGSATLVAAFSGFPKLADILIVLGTAVIVLALGLLLLWLFVWFVGGAIGGLIRGMVDLARRWCYVEVAV